MTFDIGSVSLAEIGSAVAIITAFVAILRKPGDEAGVAVKKVDQKVDALDVRLVKLESEMAHLPDKDTAHRLELAIARVEGKFEAIEARLKPLSGMAERFQDFIEAEASRRNFIEAEVSRRTDRR